MDIEFEKKIAQAFIYKNKRERFIFDMTKKDNDIFGEVTRTRFNAICRLEKIIDEAYLIMKSSQNPSPDELIKTMAMYGVGKKCYVLSEYKDLDGAYVDLRLAVDKLYCNGFPSLIVGLPSGFSHFKYESFASTQPNCFLKPMARFDSVPWTMQ